MDKRYDAWGRTTVSEMVDLLRATLQAPIAEDTVWQAVVQLAQYGLLEEQVSGPTRDSMSRREWMKRTGLTAAVALPLITSRPSPPWEWLTRQTWMMNVNHDPPQNHAA